MKHMQLISGLLGVSLLCGVPTISWAAPLLDFTEEESDAAIKLFGCDCPYCLNSLRQLTGTGNLVY